MKNENKKWSTRELAIIGLMAALVFVGSKIEIRFPTPLGGVTRFHLGNGICIISGLILGAVQGGFAAGFGSFLFDVVFWGGNPIGWCITFITKFIMAFLSGLCYQKRIFSGLGKIAAIILSGIIGELGYIAAYLTKEFVTFRIILENEMPAVKLMLIQKGISSLVNAVIAVVLSVVLMMVLVPVLKKSGLLYDRK